MATDDPDPPFTSTLSRDAAAGLDEHLRGQLLDRLGEAVIATDGSGRIVYWNDAATRLYGWQSEEVIGSDLLELTAAADIREQGPRILRTLREGRTWSGEFLTCNRDGHVFPVVLTSTPVFGENGELTAIVGVSRDVSGQHQAESALRASEERLGLVRRAAQSVIWELDPDTGIVEWSEGMSDVFGYPVEAIENRVEWWLERIHPDDRSRLEHSFDSFVEDDRRFWTEEYRFRRADGSYADVFDRAYATRRADGGKSRIAGAMVDMSERRRLQDERRLLAQASMILDLSLDFEATLPTLARLISNALADFCIIHLTPGPHVSAFTTSAHADPARQPLLDDIAQHLTPLLPEGSLLEQVLEESEPLLMRNVPRELREHAGAPAPLRDLVLQLEPSSLLVLPIRARSEGLGVLVLGSTAFRRPFGEAELRVAEELARRVGTAVDHARMYEAEQLANRAKADFLAVMSHELRTPLTAVLGYADLLANQVSGPLNATQLKQVQRIRAGSDRLHRLMESILAYVRLETGEERQTVESVELQALLDRVREVVGARAADEGVEFRIEDDGAPARIVTDPDRFLQVLFALLTNALKFAGDGTIVLRVSTREEQLELDVVDSGPGIPTEHQPYIFNAFWQVEQPTTRRAGGAGLGLSVARRLARLLDGDVVIADSSPAGTTFRFRHPLNGRR